LTFQKQAYQRQENDEESQKRRSYAAVVRASLFEGNIDTEHGHKEAEHGDMESQMSKKLSCKSLNRMPIVVEAGCHPRTSARLQQHHVQQVNKQFLLRK
jgi:hypothetical protein